MIDWIKKNKEEVVEERPQLEIPEAPPVEPKEEPEVDKIEIKISWPSTGEGV